MWPKNRSAGQTVPALLKARASSGVRASSRSFSWAVAWRRSDTTQPWGAVNVRTWRSHSSPARAAPSWGASSHTVCSRASNVNVADAVLQQPGRAHCFRTQGTYSAARPLPCHSLAVRRGFLVRVPASSANLGSAFDAVALAFARYLEVSDTGDHTPETHPAVRAFRESGGEGPLSVRAQFPGGRGLGYSGAARVAGLLAAQTQRGRGAWEARAEVLREATSMEGHADNVAASLYGGIVAVAGGRVVRVPLGRDPAVVVWVPDRETATASARRLLPEQVAFGDAVFNVGRASLLVAALASGDTDALRTATEDRLHQDRRLARAPDTRAAIAALLGAGAWAAWLSGSGPSAAALADPAQAARIASALPDTGHAFVVELDEQGATVS